MNAPTGLDPLRSRIGPDTRCSARSSAASRASNISRHRPHARLDAKGRADSRGTMNLYHYRPLAGRIYRVPILIVMATPTAATSSTWCPARALSNSCSSAATTSTCWTGARRSRKRSRLGMEDYVLNFIPRSVRRVQEDSGVEECHRNRLCFGGVLSLLYGLDLPRRADEESDLLHHAVDSAR